VSLRAFVGPVAVLWLSVIGVVFCRSAFLLFRSFCAICYVRVLLLSGAFVLGGCCLVLCWPCPGLLGVRRLAAAGFSVGFWWPVVVSWLMPSLFGVGRWVLGCCCSFRCFAVALWAHGLWGFCMFACCLVVVLWGVVVGLFDVLFQFCRPAAVVVRFALVFVGSLRSCVYLRLLAASAGFCLLDMGDWVISGPGAAWFACSCLVWLALTVFCCSGFLLFAVVFFAFFVCFGFCCEFFCWSSCFIAGVRSSVHFVIIMF